MAKRRSTRKLVAAGKKAYRTGKAGARIKWGTGGDFTRCVKQAKAHGMKDGVAKGYCARRHKEMTGVWPGDRRNTGRKVKR